MNQRLRSLLPVFPMLALVGCDWEDLAPSTRHKEDFQYNYEMKAASRLDLENFNGSVEIYGWDQEKIDIKGTRYASTQAALDSIRIDVTPSPDGVRIRTVRPSERRGNMGARYTIHLPRRTALDRVASSNGSVRVENIEGNARLLSSNGPVRALKLQGDLDAQTSNGPITLEEFQGAATLTTSNGPITVQGVKGHFEATTSNGPVTAQLGELADARPVKIRTSNGSISLTLVSARSNDIVAATSNGPITVKMPPTAGARLKAITSNSSVSSEFDLASGSTVSKARLEGTIGSGGPLLDLHTSNGSIRLVKH